MKIKILITAVCVAMCKTVISQTVAPQNCLCIPPIESKCIDYCFNKKVAKFNSQEIKMLLDTANRIGLTASKRLHHVELSKTVLAHFKDKKTMDDLKLNEVDKKAVDNLLKSKEFKKTLEEK